MVMSDVDELGNCYSKLIAQIYIQSVFQFVYKFLFFLEERQRRFAAFRENNEKQVAEVDVVKMMSKNAKVVLKKFIKSESL